MKNEENSSTIMSNIITNIYCLCGRRMRRILMKIIIAKEGGQIRSKTIRKIFKKYHNIEVGEYSYGGCFDADNIQQNTSFGKFCSIAQNVFIYNRNHPKSYVTTHPILYNEVFGLVKTRKIEYKRKTIGNDVWIGNNSIILANAQHIGNGAIIAAGAVVTKNVNDYEIVGGVPAKTIGYRFKCEDIKWLNEIQWWDWKYDEIINAAENMDDIEKFKKYISNLRSTANVEK